MPGLARSPPSITSISPMMPVWGDSLRSLRARRLSTEVMRQARSTISSIRNANTYRIASARISYAFALMGSLPPFLNSIHPRL